MSKRKIDFDKDKSAIADLKKILADKGNKQTSEDYDYEFFDALILRFYGIDPGSLIMEKYWSLLRCIPDIRAFEKDEKSIPQIIAIRRSDARSGGSTN